jgi:hypothetical protein
MEQLIDLDGHAFLAANWHERTEEWLGHRKACRSRTITAPVGDIRLPIP